MSRSLAWAIAQRAFGLFQQPRHFMDRFLVWFCDWYHVWPADRNSPAASAFELSNPEIEDLTSEEINRVIAHAHRLGIRQMNRESEVKDVRRDLYLREYCQSLPWWSRAWRHAWFHARKVTISVVMIVVLALLLLVLPFGILSVRIRRAWSRHHD